MKSINKNKLILFGAGKIGRSFVAQLFSRSDYEVVFIDINENVISKINQQHSYKVIFTSEKDEIIDVNNVRGVLFNDSIAIENELTTSNYLAVSVGKNALKFVIKLLSNLIPEILEKYPEKKFDIILAENIRNASELVRNMLIENGVHKSIIDNSIGLIETSIGKMVPVTNGPETDLDVVAEPYNDLILDGVSFKNKVPDVKGLVPKKNIKAWVDRKSFIHNLGHASLAYFTSVYDTSIQYTWQALEIEEINHKTTLVMQETAEILMHMYPEVFSKEDLLLHVKDLIHRFANKSLGDTIFRVGCDLERKLDPQDRLVPVIKYAFVNNLDYTMVLEAIVSAIFFKASDQNNNQLPADISFLNKFNYDLKNVLLNHCKFDPIIHKVVIEKAQLIEESIVEGKF